MLQITQPAALSLLRVATRPIKLFESGSERATRIPANQAFILMRTERFDAFGSTLRVCVLREKASLVSPFDEGYRAGRATLHPYPSMDADSVAPWEKYAKHEPATPIRVVSKWLHWAQVEEVAASVVRSWADWSGAGTSSNA